MEIVNFVQVDFISLAGMLMFSAYKDVVAFVILLLILFNRPKCLLGK